MAKLHFRFSSMNAGKSTALLQVAFNYEERQESVVVYTAAIDNRMGVGVVGSRIGLKRDATTFNSATNFEAVDFNGAACILFDEAQFLNHEQVRQLHRIVHQKNLPVICYGIRSDFQGEAFPGSAALLTLADDIEEMKTICKCLRKASMNMRIDHEGKKITHGDQVGIGGNESYEAVCPKCFYNADESDTKPSNSKPAPNANYQARMNRNLREGARDGDLSRMEAALASGAEIDSEGDFLGTALFAAANAGQKESVEFLLDHGADINARGKQGRTALMRAANSRNPQAVQILLTHDADKNLVDDAGMTALNIACARKNGRVARILIAENADHSIANKDGMTPLNFALEHGDEVTAMALLSDGACYDNRNGTRSVPLICAAENKCYKAVLFMLEDGANTQIIDGRGLSVMAAAKESGDDTMVFLLNQHNV